MDDADLQDTPIVAYSNLDEFKIAELEKKGAAINVYCAFTETTSVSDRPVLEAVYKLAEIQDSNGKIHYTAKLTPGKESLPGRKQVFRTYNDDGTLHEDMIGFETEHLANPLLTAYIKDGKLVKDMPTLDAIKEYIDVQLKQLPETLKEINAVHKYPVSISNKINTVLETLKKARR